MTHTDPPIVNIDRILDDPAWSDENPRRGRFEAKLGFIGRALDTEGIGINVTRVPPGQKAWPRHYHYINHEMFIVLSGTGTLHYGEAEHAIGPRDVVFIRAGTGIPFQIENTGETELEYLSLSTMLPADVFRYTDTGKIGVMARGTPLRDFGDENLPKLARFIAGDMSVGYWDGEPDAGE